ncbi:hypothetical protein DVH05_020330 [Phytophthora capsici]|nr:hypothetical protein DVH05_020330 [Phytophthora capsici]
MACVRRTVRSTLELSLGGCAPGFVRHRVTFVHPSRNILHTLCSHVLSRPGGEVHGWSSSAFGKCQLLSLSAESHLVYGYIQLVYTTQSCGLRKTKSCKKAARQEAGLPISLGATLDEAVTQVVRWSFKELNAAVDELANAFPFGGAHMLGTAVRCYGITATVFKSPHWVAWEEGSFFSIEEDLAADSFDLGCARDVLPQCGRVHR